MLKVAGLGLCFLCKEILPVVELSFQDLILSPQSSIIQLKLVILFDYLVIRVLQLILFTFFLLP